MHSRRSRASGRCARKTFFYRLAAIAAFLIWRLYDVQVVHGPALAQRGARAALATPSTCSRGAARSWTVTAPSWSARFLRRASSRSRTTSWTSRRDRREARTALRQARSGADRRASYDRATSGSPGSRARSRRSCRQRRRARLAGIQLEQENTGRRVDAARATRVHRARLHRHRRKRPRRHGVRVRRLLRGRSGEMSLEADEFGRADSFRQANVVVPAQPGLDLVLTLDSYLQFVAEQALARSKCRSFTHSTAPRSLWIRGPAKFLRWPTRPISIPTVLRIRRRRSARSRRHRRVRARLDVQVDHGRGGLENRGRSSCNVAFSGARRDSQSAGASSTMPKTDSSPRAAAARRSSRSSTTRTTSAPRRSGSRSGSRRSTA